MLQPLSFAPTVNFLKARAKKFGLTHYQNAVHHFQNLYVHKPKHEGYSYFERYKHLGNVREKIAQAFPCTKGSILDIGTGDGFFSFELAKQLQSGIVTGIDYVNEWIEDARSYAKAQEISHKCTIDQLDFWKNSFKKESFDRVTTFLALCNVMKTKADLEKGIVEINRILKPNGTILFAEGTVEDAQNQAQKLGFTVYKELGYRYFTKQEIIHVLTSHGFEITNIHYFKTHAQKFNCSQFKGWLMDEVYMGNVDGTIHTNWQTLYKKYSSSVSKTKIEFDSLITVIAAKKR